MVTGPEGLRYQGTAGRLLVHDGVPATADTMFRWASMTKAITSVAALQLIERGVLDLDTEVASLLPAHGELPVLDGFDGATPRLRPARSRATLRHLLTHTAGHAYPWAHADLFRYHQVTGTPHILSGRRAALAAPLVADPGTGWQYGASTDWLGLLVEAVSGRDLASYLSEFVLAPLGATDATFEPTARQLESVMAIHQRTRDGRLHRSGVDLPRAAEFAAGGQGLYGSARSFARFMQALLRGGELAGARILQPETATGLFRDQLGNTPLPGAIRSSMPELMNDLPPFPFRQGWSLAFHLVLEDVPGMRRAGSGDWAGLFNSYYWIDPGARVAGALFTQVLPFFDARVVELALELEKATYQGLV
ncbi:MAG TPA: serine hydrolase domain-containing protein [Polyangia bacterium]|nr:serine hydrolase domain-containing protein [Polyangia bacterium]